MTIISDLKLSAYLDNELNAEETQAIERALEESTDLRQRLQDLKLADGMARQYFQQTDKTELPAGLEQMILEAPLSRNTPSNAKVIQLKQPLRSSWQYWGIAASALLATIFIWQMPDISQQQTSLPLAELENVLETLPSGSVFEHDKGDEQWRTEVIASWRSDSGDICRELRWHTPTISIPAEACLTDSGWAWSYDTTENYITASSETKIKRNLMGNIEEQDWLNSRKH